MADRLQHGQDHDRRIKPIIYTMVSWGLEFVHGITYSGSITMTNSSGEIIAAKLIFYAGDREEYYSFHT